MKNTFVKVLSLVMALMMVVGTFGTLAVFAEGEHVHTKGEHVKTVAPTCKTPGYSIYVCEGCGKEAEFDIIPASDAHHVYELKEKVEADCLTNEKPAVELCKYCGLTRDGEARPEVEGTRELHVFKYEIKAPDCENPGYYVYTCEKCGKTADKILADGLYMDEQEAEVKRCQKTVDPKNPDAKGHNFTWTIVAPEKTAGSCKDGYAIYRCACGKKDDAQPDKVLPAHSEDDDYVELNDAPCSEWKEGARVCSNCKQYVNDEYKVVSKADVTKKPAQHGAFTELLNGGKIAPNNLPTIKENGNPRQMTLAELEAHGYALGDTIRIEPTCHENGQTLVQCNACEEIYIKTLETNGKHTFDPTAGDAYWKVTSAANCFEDTTLFMACVNEGCDYTETKVLIKASETAHNYSEAVTDPTCTTAGYTTKTCQNKFYTLVNGEVTEVDCADCTAKGATGTIVDTPVDALGHDFKVEANDGGTCDTTDDTDPTKKLVLTKVCQRCTVSEPISSYETPTKCVAGEQIVVPANCQNAGYTETRCVVCDRVMSHDDNDGEKNLNSHFYPTAEDFIYEASLVANYGSAYDKWAYDVDVVDEDGNDVAWFDGWENNRLPSCTAGGRAIVTCKVCDKGLTTMDAPAIDKHLGDEGIYGLYITEVKNDATGEKKNVVVTEAADATHNVALAANCQSVGYKDDGKICVICQAVIEAPTVIPVNPYVHVDEDADRVDDSFVNATCQSPAYEMYNTSCCGLAKVYVADHDIGTAAGELAEHAYVIMPYTAPSCSKKGNHVYVKCAWCGEKLADGVHYDGTEYGVQVFENGEAKFDADGKPVVTEITSAVDCTCGILGADLQIAIASCNPEIATTTHTWARTKVEAMKAVVGLGLTATLENYPWAGKLETCSESGSRAYDICTVCGTVSYKDVEYKVDNALSSSYAAFKAAITIAPHYTAYTKTMSATSNCNGFGVTPAKIYAMIKDGDNWVQAGKKADDTFAKAEGDLKPFELYSGTAGNYCTAEQCGEVDTWIDVIWTMETPEGASEAVKTYTAAWQKVYDYYNGANASDDMKKYYAENLAEYEGLDHAWSETIIRVNIIDTDPAADAEKWEIADCTKDSYWIRTCKNCKTVELNKNVDIAEDGTLLTARVPAVDHDWASDATEYIKDGKDCINDTFMRRSCQDCAFVEDKKIASAYGHYTDNGVEGGEKTIFDLNCNKFSAYYNTTCSGCGLTLKKLIEDKAVSVKHDVRTFEKAATCTEDGYKFSECKNCNYDDSNKDFDYPIVNEIYKKLGGDENKHVVPMNGTKEVLITYTPAQIGVPGHKTYLCARCNTVVGEDIYADYVVDTVVTLNDTTFTFGDTVVATVAITCGELEFNQLFINFAADGLELIDVESDLFRTVREGNTVTLFVENDKEGNTVNTTFEADATVLLTLTFKAAYTAAAKVTVSTDADKILTWCDDAECPTQVFDDDKNVVGHFHENNLEDTEDAKDVVAVCAIVAPGNFNNDTVMGGASDLAALLTMIDKYLDPNATLEYNAVYDMNKDGVIDDLDFNALRKFVFDGKFADAYTRMINDDYLAALETYMASESSIVNGAGAVEKVNFKNVIKNYFATTYYEDYLTQYGGDSYADIFEDLYIKSLPTA